MLNINWIFMAFAIGFMHAFEADHLAAVSNLVSSKNNTSQSVKQGFYWGLGHTFTIILIGLIMLVLKYSILSSIFSKFEGMVGVMLILLGIYRLWTYVSKTPNLSHSHSHRLAIGVGFVHGIAGSGAIVAMAVAYSSNVAVGFVYLSTFCIGSILGMLFAAFILNKILHSKIAIKINLVKIFSLCAAVFCICLGAVILYKNFIL